MTHHLFTAALADERASMLLDGARVLSQRFAGIFPAAFTARWRSPRLPR